MWIYKVAQEVALPTQGAELHGEAELVDHTAANGELLQVSLSQGEVLAQALRIEGFWKPLLSSLQARGTAVLFDGNGDCSQAAWVQLRLAAARARTWFSPSARVLVSA